MIEVTPQTRIAVQHEAAAALVDSIVPTPENRQVTYPDRELLIGSINEIMHSPGVTTPKQVRAHNQHLGEIGEGSRAEMIVISGVCKEDILPVSTPVEVLVLPHQVGRMVLQSSRLQRGHQIVRGKGQYKKPRSTPTERLADGTEVLAYMGPLINDLDVSRREPMHDRLVSGLAQARTIEEALTASEGAHVPAAHEALSLYYEEALVRTWTPASGVDYSLSGDVLWGGLRTNQPNGEILKLLGRLGNSNGVKIDGTATRDEIFDIVDVLNPDRIPGRTMYMYRFDPKHLHLLSKVIGDVQAADPHSLHMSDYHGLTSTVEVAGKKYKIRNMQQIAAYTRAVAHACFANGVRYAGTHIETTHDGHRLECVDEYGQLPTHDGNIDPQANPRQTRQIYDVVADIQAEQDRLFL